MSTFNHTNAIASSLHIHLSSMASLRSVAASTLRGAYSRPALASRLPALSRAASDAPATSSPSQPPAAKMGESGMIKQEGPAQGQPRHSPDYNVAVDYRTS